MVSFISRLKPDITIAAPKQPQLEEVGKIHMSYDMIRPVEKQLWAPPSVEDALKTAEVSTRGGGYNPLAYICTSKIDSAGQA